LTAGDLGNKKTTLSYDDSSYSHMEVEEGEEFEFCELENSELLPPIVSK
jgi:hypothetical protein